MTMQHVKPPVAIFANQSKIANDERRWQLGNQSIPQHSLYGRQLRFGPLATQGDVEPETVAHVRVAPCYQRLFLRRRQPTSAPFFQLLL